MGNYESIALYLHIALNKMINRFTELLKKIKKSMIKQQ